MNKYDIGKLGAEGSRLDKFLAENVDGTSRSKMQKMIKDGEVLVNEKRVKGSYVLKESDIVTVGDISKKDVELKPEKMGLEVLYEDEAALVINKPAGMVVHPSDDGKNLTGTVANAVVDKVRFKGQKLRPGIVHRLDKETSGALIVAKTEDAYENLVDQFKNRKVEKIYKALVLGIPKEKEGIIKSPIGRAIKDRKKMRVSNIEEGREAITEYKTINKYKIDEYTLGLLDVGLKTGRTHQIRVHMSAISHPVVGDTGYGNKKVNKLMKEKFGLKRQFLHAYKIKFNSPGTGKMVSVKSELPDELKTILLSLR